MVGRIAANARKLERLLSDLLDLDRLQRGIISPKRRATDLEEFVRRACEEIEHARASDRDRRADGERQMTPGEDRADPGEPAVQQPPTHAGGCRRSGCARGRTEGGVLFIVEDDGPGVPPDLREAIFEPSDRRRVRPPGMPPASASVCPSCDASPSCTAATRGPRNARAVERPSTSSCPGPDGHGRVHCVPDRSEPAVGLEPTT